MNFVMDLVEGLLESPFIVKLFFGVICFIAFIIWILWKEHKGEVQRVREKSNTSKRFFP